MINSEKGKVSLADFLLVFDHCLSLFPAAMFASQIDESNCCLNPTPNLKHWEKISTEAPVAPFCLSLTVHPWLSQFADLKPQNPTIGESYVNKNYWSVDSEALRLWTVRSVYTVIGFWHKCKLWGLSGCVCLCMCCQMSGRLPWWKFKACERTKKRWLNYASRRLSSGTCSRIILLTT